jgi:tRNA 2-thiocytidine biosynthesis protein TtcA
LPEYLSSKGIPFHIEEQDTYSIVKRVIPEGKTLCSLCSRLRRGALYKVASQLGANKIALGHHRDDILQTFLLNLFFGGRLKSMPPKLLSDEGNHIVIRPMAYVNRNPTCKPGPTTKLSPSFLALCAVARKIFKESKSAIF